MAAQRRGKPPAVMPPPGSLLNEARSALVVARDAEVRRYLLEALSRAGYPSVPCVEESGAILDHCKANRLAFVIMDEGPGYPKRTDVVRELRERGAKVPVILLRGGSDEEAPSARIGLGPIEYLPTPFTLKSLTGVIARACGSRSSGLTRRGRGRDGERSRSRGGDP